MSMLDNGQLYGYLRKRHSVSKFAVHLMFTTKYRRELIEMDGEQDHVHLLIAYPPKLLVNVMMNNLKSILSRMLRL